ncbi:MAG: sialate O-acetylesterase [Bacteroidota bacterium]
MHAQLSTSPLFGDQMVLQREQPIRIWGQASPGATVALTLHVRSGQAVADANGYWEAEMESLPAGGPHQLTVTSGAQTITHQDVYMGEVWVCSGQSNMARTLKFADNGTQEAANANFPQIRFFTAAQAMATAPNRDISGTWKVCNPTNAPFFSGTGFFFARDLHQNLGVPIGIVDVTIGGTAINTWLDPAVLQGYPGLEDELAALDGLDLALVETQITNAQADFDQQMESTDLGLQQQWQNDNFNWQSWPTMLLPDLWEANGLPNTDGSVWFKRSFTLTAAQASADVTLGLGRVDDSDQTYVNGQFVGERSRDPGTPRWYNVPANVVNAGTNTVTVRVRDYGFVGGLLGEANQMKVTNGSWEIPLAGNWHYQRGTPNLSERPANLDPDDYLGLAYHGMISPLLGLSMAGVCWYQGESDTGDPYYYRIKQVLLIDQWREAWGIGDFPFITTQLAAFRPEVNQPGVSSWATLRESQLATLKRNNTALISLVDAGDAEDIHPGDKLTVGLRLSGAARRLVYGQSIPAYSPTFLTAQAAANHIDVRFRTYGSPLQTTATSLRGFAIAGEDGNFVWADAQLVNGQMVRVSSAQVPNPRYVRYAWSDNPGLLDLYNSGGLPALPFRTDEFPTPWN